MATYKIGVLYGDGIGPEITKATVDVLTAASKLAGTTKFEFVELPMGWDGIEKYNDPMPQSTKDALKETHGWIMGPHDSASYPKELKEKRNPSGELRTYFDLYANVRPAKTMEGIRSVVGDADLVIYRENTEGYYCDRNMYVGVGEWKVTPDIVISAGVFTRKAIERIAHAAFKAALQRRKKVTIVHKANVIQLGSGLFLDVCREVGQQYPDVEVDDYHIDAMAAHLVRRANDFDVIVTENMFGDILSDLTGELVGSLGLAPSINSSDNQAMAQAAHGSAPDIAGKNIANPTGIILSAVMFLEWLASQHNDPKVSEIARNIENGLFLAISEGVKTKDLGGTASTTEFTEGIIERLKR
ncbi:MULTISPECIES: isocitrate/isopropylmalate dehydrogenase family protein [Heyndrickxia]|uniref:3-isopropylmalate dehydrogenase n=1 Tax=Heyndrickxia sporothermodurans TaxID=46224 RepID=A0A150LIG0_9BACI|nr:isocitrate/isopropylmalate dehydrogenase family protein [Heyndrickxia sporothermodurans]KYD11532.1 3-isopropylmalate dehydrogenase [Heyndrickxia sporothermodurans]MBL5769114.1 isocitrate/isopropylmalate dehydrogenase family protein [Heyndrickxia sporothermodurans]MBL5772892.1 isocitrate/isopropylmalate dehydrogenase family protein [Heyndrickxia sporothermodurans]MBL5779897.1 isocitrate/isopropylmalate dehydrogenase family protein [Heyndrickxia sporothermodurans]MBL5782109.1 isocitrate/isopr